VTGFPAGGPIGHGGGSSCSLSSCSQAAQCNIHQASITCLSSQSVGAYPEQDVDARVAMASSEHCNQTTKR
jgi:hypothetical protein